MGSRERRRFSSTCFRTGGSALAQVSKKGMRVLALGAAITAVPSCGSQDPVNPSLGAVVSVAITGNEGPLRAIGDTLRLAVQVLDGSARSVDVVPNWSSSDTLVVTVIDGLVTAGSDGEAAVSARVNGIADTVTVHVEQVIASIAADTAALHLVVGDTSTLVAEARDSNGHAVPDAPLLYESTDETVAEVSDSGTILAVSPGEAEVLVISSDTARVAVAVEEELSISTSVLPEGTLTREYRAELEARGGSGTLRWAFASGSLPDGLIVTDDGAVSGVPAETGSFEFEVTVEGRHQQVRAAVELVVRPEPQIRFSYADSFGVVHDGAVTVSDDGTDLTWSVAAEGSNLASGRLVTVVTDPTTVFTIDDGFAFSPSSTQSIWTDVGPSCDPDDLNTLLGFDELCGRTSDGFGTESASGGGVHMLATKPLDSGDDMDLAASVGDTLHLYVQVQLLLDFFGTGPEIKHEIRCGGLVSGTENPQYVVGEGLTVDVLCTSSDRSWDPFLSSGHPLVFDAGVLPETQFAVGAGIPILLPLEWSLDGELPPGLFIPAGQAGTSLEFAGTPTTAGEWTFTLSVTDARGLTGSREYTLTVR